MKKVQIKRTGLGLAKPKDLMKPYGFCCDVNRQDPETRYNMRVSPFVTSLTSVAPTREHECGPDLKFRLQDIGKPTSPTLRTATHKVKSSTHPGRGKTSRRGPLRWYIEEEIALAQDIIANEREATCKRDKKLKLQLRRTKKNMKKKLTRSKIDGIIRDNDDDENDDANSAKDGETTREGS